MLLSFFSLVVQPDEDDVHHAPRVAYVDFAVIWQVYSLRRLLLLHILHLSIHRCVASLKQKVVNSHDIHNVTYILGCPPFPVRVTNEGLYKTLGRGYYLGRGTTQHISISQITSPKINSSHRPGGWTTPKRKLIWTNFSVSSANYEVEGMVILGRKTTIPTSCPGGFLRVLNIVMSPGCPS